ncbi:MAG: hypothetical protein HKP30_01490, partial [Myxococcales bacterium]|nr:hypothetical protein [Myxococcales bacterium]
MPRPCPVCHHRSASELARGVDFEYGSLPGPFHMWACDACGHGYLDPLPARDELPTIYPSTYYTVNPRSPIHFDGAIYETKLRRDVERIASFVEGRPIRSVVDLGCGDAERLARLRERLGPDVAGIGVDFQPDAGRAPELARRGVRIV